MGAVIVEPDAEDGTILLTKNSDGTYSKVLASRSATNATIPVRNILGPIYENQHLYDDIYSKVTEDIYVSVDRIILSSDDENFLECLYELDISDICKNSIYNTYISLSADGRADFSIYLPKHNVSARSMTVERTTYTGYGNQEYYQEFYTTSFMSGQSQIIYNKNFGDNSQYLSKTFILVGVGVVGAIADYFTGGAITLVNLVSFLFNTDASATHKIEATLHETRMQKITFYVQSDGIKLFGSNVSMAKDGFFQLVEQVAMSGVVNTDKLYLAQRKTSKWDEPQDVLAYNWSGAGGITQVLDSIHFGGQSFG